MEDNLATELLKEVKSQAKRWYHIAIILALLLFISNALWLFAWCLPVDDVQSDSYEVISESMGNAILNESGEVSVNGESE